MSDDMHGQILKLKAKAFDAIKNDINNMRHGNIDFDQAGDFSDLEWETK